MLKRMTLLAITAIAAMAFVGTASASAAEFLKEGGSATGRTETYTGPITFQPGWGTVSCAESEAEVEFTGGAGAAMTSFDFHPSSCKTTGALGFLCGSVESSSGNGELEAVAPTKAKFSATIEVVFATCGLVTLTIGEATLTPVNSAGEPTNVLETLVLSGGKNTSLYHSNSAEVSTPVNGTLSAANPAEPYEIG